MYQVKVKKRFFWKTYKNVIGHAYQVESDKLDLFFADRILSIKEWSKYDMKLGQDFLTFQKEEMRKESGK